MNKVELENALISIFPDFREHWSTEDIYKEEGATFTAHGLMRSFLHFYRDKLEGQSESSLKKLSLFIEEELHSDPKGELEVANAIYTEFLELIDNKESSKLNSYLRKSCEEYYKAWVI